MTDTDRDAPRVFADALVDEIWAEMGRRRVKGVRALARLTGMNHVSLNDRLTAKASTGKRVKIGQEDLWRICSALGVEPWEMVRRAATALGAPTDSEASETEVS